MHPAASIVERSRAALVVVDIQERLAAVMERREQVIAKTSLLIRAAAIAGVPIIVTRQYPKGLGGVEPAIEAALDDAREPGARLLSADKVCFDCFAEPAFREVLAETGAQQVVLCGMETHICVTQTALAALRDGLEVFVAADACCSREREAHETSMARLGLAGAVPTVAESVAYELIGRAGTDEFKALLSAVKG